jgi:hypothetical protein
MYFVPLTLSHSLCLPLSVSVFLCLSLSLSLPCQSCLNETGKGPLYLNALQIQKIYDQKNRSEKKKCEKVSFSSIHFLFDTYCVCHLCDWQDKNRFFIIFSIDSLQPKILGSSCLHTYMYLSSLGTLPTYVCTYFVFWLSDFIIPWLDQMKQPGWPDWANFRQLRCVCLCEKFMKIT